MMKPNLILKAKMVETVPIFYMPSLMFVPLLSSGTWLYDLIPMRSSVS